MLSDPANCTVRSRHVSTLEDDQDLVVALDEMSLQSNELNLEFAAA